MKDIGKKLIIGICFILLFTSPVYAGTTDTSGVTAQTIIDRTQNILNTTSTDFWDADDYLQWIDAAVWEIVLQTRCLESGSSAVTLATDDRDYTLSELTILDVEKVEYDSGDTSENLQIFDLDRVPFSKLRYGHEKEAGKPKTFAVWNETLYIWPIPRSDQSGTTLYVYYVTRPTGVTASYSPIETPAYFDYTIPDYVRAQAHFKEKREARGNYYLQRFYQKIREYVANVLRREVGE